MSTTPTVPVTLAEASRVSKLSLVDLIALMIWPNIADALGYPGEDGIRWGLGEDDIIYVDLDDVLMFATVWPILKEPIRKDGRTP
jgi:hypothetical protein